MVDKAAILRQIRINRRLGLPKRKGRNVNARLKYPYVLERTYQRELREYANNYIKIVERILLDKLPELVNEAASLRPDGVNTDSWVTDLLELINAITFAVGPQEEKIKSRLGDIFEKVNKFNKDDITRVIRSVLGVNIFTQEPWLKEQLDNFLSQNAVLIKNLPAKATEQIQMIAQRGLASGETAEVVGERIRKQFKMTKRRAELIARDQIATLNGVLTGLRQTNLGITSFIWRTSLDERVRELHEEREGETFDWDHVFDETPDDGPPGLPINCRCVAEPVLTGLLEEI